MSAVIQPIACVYGMGVNAVGPMMPAQLEGTSQTFIPGCPLIYSSGLIVTATATPTSGLIGIAAGKASGTANTPVSVIPFLKNLIFEISIDGTLSNSNAPGTGVASQREYRHHLRHHPGRRNQEFLSGDERRDCGLHLAGLSDSAEQFFHILGRHKRTGLGEFPRQHLDLDLRNKETIDASLDHRPNYGLFRLPQHKVAAGSRQRRQDLSDHVHDGHGCGGHGHQSVAPGEDFGTRPDAGRSRKALNSPSTSPFPVAISPPPPRLTVSGFRALF